MVAQESIKTPESPPLAPTRKDERIDSLDLIRGVAVLGILLVNINSFALPGTSFSRPYLWGELDRIDRVVFALNYLFVQNKFYSLFSMLFGAGLLLQSERLANRSEKTLPILLRRLGILAGVGIVHAFVVWRGDILFWYALVGFLVLPLRGLKARHLLLIGILFLTLPMLLGLGPVAIGSLAGDGYNAGSPSGGTVYPFPANEEMAENLSSRSFWERLPLMIMETPEGVALEVELYREGSFLERTGYRVVSWLVLLVAMPLSLMWSIWGYMLVGAALMKAGVFARFDAFKEKMASVGAVGFFLGLGVTALGLPFVFNQNPPAPSAANLLLHYGALGLTAGYLGFFLSVSQSAMAMRLAAPFKAAGRMAFTNYLMQSLVFAWVFHGSGLGLFARYGYAELMPFVAGMWVFQLLFSTFWLGRFRYGPMEWLWRRLTYGGPLAMRRYGA